MTSLPLPLSDDEVSVFKGKIGTCALINTDTLPMTLRRISAKTKDSYSAAQRGDMSAIEELVQKTTRTPFKTIASATSDKLLPYFPNEEDMIDFVNVSLKGALSMSGNDAIVLILETSDSNPTFSPAPPTMKTGDAIDLPAYITSIWDDILKLPLDTRIGMLVTIFGLVSKSEEVVKPAGDKALLENERLLQSLENNRKDLDKKTRIVERLKVYIEAKRKADADGTPWTAPTYEDLMKEEHEAE